MHIHCCQFSPAWEDKFANFQTVARWLERDPPRAGSLVILPEMFATGFSMNFPEIAEDPEHSPTLDFLREQSHAHNCSILAGVALRDGEFLTNDAVLLNSSGELVGRYRKIHPFTPSGEHTAAAAGNWVTTMPFSGPDGEWTLAPFICYDLRFPEIFRLATPAAEVMIVLANWPSPRVEHWVTLLKARAIENQAYVIGVNRIGSDPNLDFPGRSLVIDPKGEIVADAGDRKTILKAELDLSFVRQWRQDFPAQQDRHPLENLGLQEVTSP